MKETRYNRLTGIMAEERIENSMLAEYVGVTKETVSLWRTNKVQPSLPTLYKIAEFFKIDPRDLLVPRTWPTGPSPAELARAAKEKKKGKKK